MTNLGLKDITSPVNNRQAMTVHIYNTIPKQPYYIDLTFKLIMVQHKNGTLFQLT